MGEFLWAYDSVDEMMKSMPCELRRKVSSTSSFHNFTVFWSKNNDELSRLLTDSSITNTCTGTSPMDFIQVCLEFIQMENYLVQIWAPVTVGDKRYLTTSDQPFVLAKLVKGLCSYRKQCLDYLIPIDEGHVGPPGRVFLNGLPEVCLDVRHYTTKEYPQCDSALNYGIRCYLAFPFYKRYPHENDCVVELVANGFQPRMYNFADQIYPMELGEKLFVEVIKISPTDELDSFEICDLTGDDSTPNTMGYPYRGEMVQLDSTMSNAENAPGGESSEVHRMTPIPASSHLPVKTMQFASSSYDNHGFARKMRQEGTEAFPAAPSMMDPYAGKDKARSALHHEGAANVLLDANNLHQHGGEVVHFGSATSHAGNVNNVEQNIFSVEQYDINSIGEIVQLDDAINNTENMNTNVVEQNDSMEQHDTNSNISKNRRAIKRIEREYGITCADLLQHSGKKQEEAANHFGVSRSTFKRICRQHKIFRWRPCKLKQDDDLSNTTQDLIQTSEKIMEDSHVKDLPLPIKPVEQDLNSKPNSTQNAMTVQNGGSIIVKVTYRDDMINFHLSVSSGKMALEEEIAKRFCLSIGSFSTKYLDEDEDEILVTCDVDLKTSISIMRSLGKNTVKMLVKLSQDN